MFFAAGKNFESYIWFCTHSKNYTHTCLNKTTADCFEDWDPGAVTAPRTAARGGSTVCCWDELEYNANGLGVSRSVFVFIIVCYCFRNTCLPENYNNMTRGLSYHFVRCYTTLSLLFVLVKHPRLRNNTFTAVT